MISHSSKFPLRTEFLHFRTRAARCVTPHTIIYYLKSTSSARLAVVVPKKVSKLATTRNDLKRLSYDAVWPELNNKNLDCVVVYKPLPLTKSIANKKQIVAELSSLTFAN